MRHLFHSHPRLILAVVAGLVVGAVVPQSWRPVTRVLAGWNVIVWLYLAQMAWLMATATSTRVREIAEREDNNAVVVLAILSIAAAFSLVAIVLELSSSKGMPDTQKVLHYVFTAITVLGSWLLVATTYTVHYARLFYLSPVKQRALRFPEDELHPGYADFLYFSFTIAVAAQTSDVLVMSPSIRKAVLAQSVLSFLFNAAIIGLSINIAAGLVGN
ncbi:DUF1345 domain-containing protein [Actimicrobium sp. CCC2.4]|uniref:DUF1345 domain-containing protein n=1 Tax=Actimicrobium sp. CCC2.4 TaxID=3048606 RepID=UPI002AC96706|nr:DUF1345 domain-containing protein [Actimicrobium sp. CCC2.4]MEB0135327.1 DUF1345 domain-containing protein [Actimicrobium sp. CCC2.4]WPX31116.1 DUF1345 domain-containing protein [Actimicrobium sp. CCC2.4]